MHLTGVHVEPRLAQPLATLERCSNGLEAAIVPYRHTGTGALEAGGRLCSSQAEDFEVWQDESKSRRLPPLHSAVVQVAHGHFVYT